MISNPTHSSTDREFRQARLQARKLLNHACSTDDTRYLILGVELAMCCKMLRLPPDQRVEWLGMLQGQAQHYINIHELD